MIYKGDTGEFLQLEHIDSSNCDMLQEKIESSLTVLWFTSDHNEMMIDGKTYDFNKNQVVFLTEFHRVQVDCVANVRLLKFNRPFYCILDHDDEVGCRGMLFFGASSLPIITIPEEDLEVFQTLWKMFNLEFASEDNLQRDMLQMMLKRYLILSARIYKVQGNFPKEENTADIIRAFNYLVEQHFRTKHTVSEYAELLHKSPKTLANVFAKLGYKTPLQYIQERRMLEARRLIRHSDKQIQEIAYEIGFEDLPSFSRFFKKYESVSPSFYRENR